MKATILTGDPVVTVLAEQCLDYQGVMDMAEWVKSHRPECVPADGFETVTDLLPHNGIEEGDDGVLDRCISDNELLVELAGRKCYDSFAEKAGRKTNKDYIAHTQQGEIKHASIMYHAKMTFFLAGISRRVSHELIRNYVGSDRNEEGSPSQESTRYTHHYGFYVMHPRDIGHTSEMKIFEEDMNANYKSYTSYIHSQIEQFKAANKGAEPKGMDRKRIYEAASQRLSHACETSFIWTTNPLALQKLFKERGHEAADLEFQRLVKVWKGICLARWPNLFQ